MDQSITIGGRIIRLNGEMVARVLGDFSAQVLADALQLYFRQNPPAPLDPLVFPCSPVLAQLPGAPHELVEKAREYVPAGQIGLLRLYADKRGFSCCQVDAAISMVGGAV